LSGWDLINFLLIIFRIYPSKLEPSLTSSLNLPREFSIKGEGDGTACAVINQLWAWLFQNKTNIFLCTNSQFLSGLTTAQAVDTLPPV
jgi:hypothetical protein